MSVVAKTVTFLCIYNYVFSGHHRLLVVPSVLYPMSSISRAIQLLNEIAVAVAECDIFLLGEHILFDSAFITIIYF